MADVPTDGKPAGQEPDATHPQMEVTQDFGGNAAQATRLVEVLDQYLAALKAGTAPDRNEFLSQHPDLAAELARYLDGMDFLHASGAATQPGKRLGDFRIIREVGHGGMGAVYEAEQLSLHRRVALKVLRFGRVSDPDALERFQREAETVACLHHTNIVPIFAIGSEGGVNYYAMQFIVGRSLDQVLKDSRGPIDAQRVARWGLAAAEALSHAHARGVIHRDVKPSNLLLDDAEGRIWLTDFGLAKRLDDVTLSMTGALLGTPRYMSPEQASASTNKLDHRTDIYSLGASLYELATGKPVFIGDSPHNVISQILTAEPEPPRRHCPSLPRDLETILMKCLGKEPGQRYSSAQQLADDLRAFLDGRPISARRASLVELGHRWVKQQQRSLVLTAAAVLVTLLMVTMTAAGSYFWHRSRLAQVKLDTDRPPLIAEVLDHEGNVVSPRATIPMQQTAEVPAGNYRLQLQADERLSQEYEISLAPGDHLAQKIDLQDQLLWGDLRYPRSYRSFRVVESPVAAGYGVPSIAERTDLLLLQNEGVQRIDGRTGTITWTLAIVDRPGEVLKNAGLDWIWQHNRGHGNDHGVGSFDIRPHLVSAPADHPIDFDLDGDGVSDLVLALRHQARLLAISTKAGKPIWAAKPSVANANAKEKPEQVIFSSVPYPPLVVPDQDGDGVAELAAWFLLGDERTGEVVRSMDLLSGKTGKPIWQITVEPDYFKLPQGEDVPQALAWFYGFSGGYSSGGSGSSWNGRHTRRTQSRLEKSGVKGYLPSTPVLINTSDKPQIAFLAGTTVLKRDLASGESAGEPAEVGTRTHFAPRWSDLDGDGQTDLLLTTTLPDKPAVKPGWPAIPQVELTAWSPAKKSELWRATIEAKPPVQQEMYIEAPTWPIVQDVNADGAAEILVPDGSSFSMQDWTGAPRGTVAMLDGRSGQAVWRREIYNVDQQLDRFVAGPDIDGDGCREIYVASLWKETYDLYVDCLSGRDGETLWRSQRPAQRPGSGSHRLAPLDWYSGKGDKAPQLIVRLLDSTLPCYGALFDSETGRRVHEAPNVAQVQAADFDGDGIDDLLLAKPDSVNLLDGGGRLHVVRGAGKERHRAVMPGGQALADLNADGVIDVVQSLPFGRLIARSGTDGSQLWSAYHRQAATLHAPRAVQSEPEVIPRVEDLNRDGVPDLLLVRMGHEFDPAPVLSAVSGKNGSVLWRSELACQMIDGVSLLEARDLDGDSQPEIILIAGLDVGLPRRNGWSSQDTSLWLAVLSGTTGKSRFQKCLVERRPNAASININSVWLESSYADLNGDGVLDLVLPAAPGPGKMALEMRVLSGTDGSTLWAYPLPVTGRNDGLNDAIPPLAQDFDGDGRPEIVIAHTYANNTGGTTANVVRLVMLNGADGKQRWQHDAPCDHYYAQIQNGARLPVRVRPIPLRRGNERWIALLTRRQTNELVVLNAQGEVQCQNSQPRDVYEPETRLWACDTNGDGNDELILLRERSLQVVAADRLDEPVWKQVSDHWNSSAIVGVLRDAKDGPQIVVKRLSGGAALFAVSAASGALSWSAPGPAGSEATLLRAPAAGVSPVARFAFNNLSVVREGMVHGADSQTTTQTAVLSHHKPLPTDPRRLRPLPWVPNDYDLRNVWSFCLWSVFYGVTLWIVPVSYLVHLVCRRQWSLQTFLLMPVVVGLFMMGVTIQGPDNDFRHLSNKFAIAACGVGPIAFALFLLGKWLRQGKWRTVAAWLVLALLIAGKFALILMLGGLKGDLGLEAGEEWDTRGWYWILPPAYFGVALFLYVATPLWWLGRMIWGRFKSPAKVGIA